MQIDTLFKKDGQKKKEQVKKQLDRIKERQKEDGIWLERQKDSSKDSAHGGSRDLVWRQTVLNQKKKIAKVEV